MGPEQTLADLNDIFSKVHYHHLPVIEEKQLLGIVSDRDVSHSMSPFINTVDQRVEDEALLRKLVRDIMTPNPIVVDRTTSIECASILLLENNISCLPVVGDCEVLEGLLTWKDILNFHVYY